MYDIQLSERNIVIEKSKNLGLIGVFVQQNYNQTNAPRVQASGSHSAMIKWKSLPSYDGTLKQVLTDNFCIICKFLDFVGHPIIWVINDNNNNSGPKIDPWTTLAFLH